MPILLLAWATPCYALAYGGSIWVVSYHRADTGTTALGWWGVAALFALSTILFRRPLSLYPALGAALAAILATARVLAPDLSGAELLALLIVPAWILAAVADIIASLRPAGEEETPGRWPFLGAERLLASEWAAPPLAFALGALILATVGSATETGIGLIAALAGTTLLVVVATRWRGEGEAWGAIGLATLAFWHLLRVDETPPTEQGTRWALLALALTLVAIGIRALTWSLLDPWRRPLSLGAMAYAAWALGVGFVYALDDSTGQQTFAFTLALTGLTLIAHGFDRRERLLGYAGVACLEAGYMVHLFVHEIGQPQAFALPAGIFLLAVAYLEWRRGTGTGIKATLEIAALSILLTVSAIQALGYLGDFVPQEDVREVYGSFMLIEAVVLLALGAVLRWRRTFYGGGIGIVLAVGLLLFDPFRSLHAMYIAAIIGFTMIALVIFIEQRRQQIPVWLGEWRARLEVWD